MSDLLKTGSDWLAEQMKAHASVTVIYQRGVESVEVKATIGRSDFEAESEYGVIERTESRDFLLLVADLVLGGIAATPQRGDRIKEAADDGKTYTYEVMAPGSEPVWRYGDPYRKVLRVHAKHVETDTT